MTVMKNSHRARCRSFPVDIYTSFEAQLLNLDWNGPVCLGVIYRPPHSVKDFLQQFTDFTGEGVRSSTGWQPLTGHVTRQ